MGKGTRGARTVVWNTTEAVENEEYGVAGVRLLGDSMSFGASGEAGGGSGQEQTQQSGSERVGLFGPQRTRLADFLTPKFTDTYEPYLRSQLETPFKLPTLGSFGVYPEQEEGLLSGFNQQLAKTSSDYAKRGFLAPRATSLVASTAVRDFAPQYAALVGRNVENQQVVPEEIRRQRFAEYLGILQTILDAIGARSTNIMTGSSSRNQEQTAANIFGGL